MFALHDSHKQDEVTETFKQRSEARGRSASEEVIAGEADCEGFGVVGG